jgi:bifunctional DNA-binding transcriptional regulator/antitoxin component of YhaV-PrlF toxin-antitoxin module
MGSTSTLIKSFARVDSKGRVLLPDNIRRTLELRENQLLELKVIGTRRHRNVLISKREVIRQNRAHNIL